MPSSAWKAWIPAAFNAVKADDEHLDEFLGDGNVTHRKKLKDAKVVGKIPVGKYNGVFRYKDRFAVCYVTYAGISCVRRD